MPYPLLALILAGALLSPTSGSDWGRFRGPTADGLSSETGLLKSWPEEGPKVLWRAPLGEGFSGLSVFEGRIYTMAGQGADELVVALDAATGKEIWRRRVDAKRLDEMGNGPRSTPTVDGAVVYSVSSGGKLHALSGADGAVLWTHDLVKEYGARIPQWGISTSPLVEQGKVLVEAGGPSAQIVAFDKKTGKEVWRSQSDKAGYSTPLAVTIGGVQQVLFFSATGLRSVSPVDGRLFWKFGWKTSYDVNAAMPIFVPPDKVFISSGYDVGAALLQVTVADGKPGVREVWRTREMKNQFSTSVLHGGYLYGFDDKTLKALEVKTGETAWQSRGLGHGSLFYAEGHLFVLGDNGVLALVEATPAEYREKGRAQVFAGKTWTVPTLARGKLYLRDEKEIVALDVQGG